MSDSISLPGTLTEPLRIPSRRSALTIALGYALVGGLWVLGSDWVLHRAVPSEVLQERLSVLKGWVFVGVTALLLGWGLDRYFRLIRRSARLLQDSEERWMRALEGAAQAVWDWDVQTDEVHYSPAWKAMLGYAPDEIGPRLSEWERRIHPEDVSRVLEAVRRHVDGETVSYASEHRLRCKDGTFKWILDQGKATQRAVDGKALRMVGTHADIDRRKRAEVALAASEANFRAFFQTVDDLIVVATREGRLLCGNAAVTRRLGYSAEELTRLTVPELHPPTVREEAREILAAMLRGERQTCPLPLAGKDGALLPVETRVWLGQWDGEPCVFGVSKDLRAEQEAQQRFERLFRHNPMPMALSEIPGQRLIDVNDAWLRTLGYTRDAVVGKTFRDLNLFQSPAAQEALAAQLQARQTLAEVELQVRTREGRLRDGLFSGEIVHSQGKDCFLTVMVDVTERKQAESALRERLELQDQLTKVAATVPGLICSFRLEPNGKASMPFCTPAIADLYGLQPEDVREDFSPILAQVHPEDRDPLQRSIAESARTLEPWHAVFRSRHPERGELWVEGHSVPRREPDGSILWHGFVQDVTARKRSETARRESERQLATLMANLPGMAYRCLNGPDWPMVFVSDGCAALTGYTRVDLMRQTPAFGDLIVAEDRPAVWDSVQRALEHQEPFEMTYRIQAPSGEVRWVWERGRGVLAGDGRLLFLEGFITDISERKRLEQERESALIKYRTLFDALPLGVAVTDPHGRIVESNRVAEELLSVPGAALRERHAGGPEWRAIRPDGTPMPPEEFASVRALRDRRRVADVEMGLVKSPTEITWITVTAAPVPLPDLGVVITFTDLSARKQAEEALRLSEQKYRVVADNTFDWEFWIDPAGRYVYTSPSCERISGHPPAAFAEDPHLMARLIHPEDRSRFEAHQRRVREGHLEPETEFRVVRPDGEVRWVGHVCGAIHDPAGALLGLRGSNRDITERKRAEALLRESLLFRREAEKIARIGAWKVNPETNYLLWTEGVYEILEIPLDHPLGLEEGLRFYDPESIPVLRAALETALREGTPFTVEAGVTTRTGRQLWTEVRGLGGSRKTAKRSSWAPFRTSPGRNAPKRPRPGTPCARSSCSSSTSARRR